MKVLTDQAADKNNIGNHLAHNFVGIKTGFHMIADDRGSTMAHKVLTVVCETKWDETKWNETKWDETKWKSVVCEMEICSLRNGNL